MALNLVGERLAVEQIHRGDWLLHPLLHAPTQRIDVDFQLRRAKPTNSSTGRPCTHLGAQDVTARVALLEGTSLASGERAFAQLLLNAPSHAVHGDRIVLRDQSAQRTLGGGRVLDPFAPPRNRRRAARLEQLRALNQPSLEQALPPLLASATNGIDPQGLERQFNRPREGWQLPTAY